VAVSRNVLIARLDSAGDVVLASPAVAAVAATEARITFLSSTRGAAAARLLPDVAGFLVYDAPWVLADPPALDPASVALLVADLHDRNFDEAIILTSFHQSPLPLALLLRMAGVPRITAESEDYPGSLLDVRVRFDAELHEAQRARRIAEAAGYPGQSDRLRVREQLPAVDHLVPDGPYVVVHPGSDAPARQWPAECARAAVLQLTAEGRSVVVTGGPDEVELTAAVAGTEATDLGGRTDWSQLAAVIRSADVVVVGNTGPAHLAAALGVPVVSIFAPTVPVRRWGPTGVRSVVLGDQQAACAGTRARHCPVPRHPCLSDIPTSHVVAAVDQLVGSAS
jgi:ADP-heptose:LPS heptosyltransferase